MTMKTSKNNSTILSRFGAAALIGAALAVTAPVTISAQESDAPKVETKMKKIIKLVENENGVETKKTYEIITENGVTTAYSIDEHGNKTVVDVSEIKGMKGMGDHGDMNMFVMDGGHGEKHMKIVTNGHMEGMEGGEHGQIRIKRVHKSGDGTEYDVDSNVFVIGEGGSHASAMVRAAQDLLDRAENMSDGEDISNKARKKLEKARKALREAQEALDAE